MLKRLFDISCSLFALFLLSPSACWSWPGRSVANSARRCFSNRCARAVTVNPLKWSNSARCVMRWMPRQSLSGLRAHDTVWLISCAQQPGRVAGIVECSDGRDEPGRAAPVVDGILAALFTREQARRHEVRPGVTGWAQINGRNALSWEDKFKLDVWYADNQSLWLDLKILLLTVKKVFVREGISGAGEVTMSKFAGSSVKGRNEPGFVRSLWGKWLRARGNAHCALAAASAGHFG